MGSQNMVTVRVKPVKPTSGTRISLNALDKTFSYYFTPLNLFFKPSSLGPTKLENFVDSLQDVLDRLPLIAGSIYNVEDAHGAKSKELVDDGRGVDLIWGNSPIAYVDHLEVDSLMPRSLAANLEISDETILMVKFTKACSLLSTTLHMNNSLFSLPVVHWPCVSVYHTCSLIARLMLI